MAGQIPLQLVQPTFAESPRRFKSLKKLRGGFLLTVGYLLSPLCWWNDLFFNLPIAYFFGYLCSWFSPNLLSSCSIVGYWLSNIIGILLMQLGVIDVFQDKPKTSLKKELLTGLVSSTIYTLIILALIQFKILDAPLLFSNQAPTHSGSSIPMLIGGAIF
ncbi:hypothetical protein [Leptolyngbya sp. FACHB-261]|uniref:hypothetical protein n=1 Tax=Leptolyngbya sp. FACHB-261 TaxID=2692806 RepID=UPI00168503A8|nr:hypothetical protein [Leptolyngbya sp. FACHB-261]MBD2104578.1 hypothetical protein [Leptolyngbya sp. FACHB-261]